ncbi:Oidioi.mRNA.OKI2018_I69.chr1.g3854.t1.cds [Oikopleura dioica]|uniref:Oidioi.mRNA.OKI2018_I69.chr1.g3854.t1.cds n=1 Tax=Oikopleura dioica TaxID=34765 RepID=A0ABN7T0Z1_OIKDI|nr:Oidioi.mRNA.OKI2018_I69.chr1.g3854.t1.cds [Oikopleura dioica]
MTQRRSYVTQRMDLDDPANRSFWTRNRTECLLRLLTEQAQLTGDIDHESVAQKMTSLLSLPIPMKKQNISDRLEAMFHKYQCEQLRVATTGFKPNWIWNEQLQHIIELLQEREDAKEIKGMPGLSQREMRPRNQNPASSSSVIVINDDSPDPPKQEIPVPVAKPLFPVGESSTASSSKLPSIANSASVAKKSRSEPEIRPKETLKIGIKGTPQILPHPSLIKNSSSSGVQNMVIAVKQGSEPIFLLGDGKTVKVSPSVSISTDLNIPSISVASQNANRASVSDSSHGKITIAPKKPVSSLPAQQEDSSSDGRSKRTIRPPQSHLNLLIGEETRTRMPDAHVHFMLKMYKQYLNDRMLTSGRLSKGTFNEIANDLNKEFGVSYYEREQVASKLQNLKTQYRQRRVGVAEGNIEELSWKWYKEMQDILSIESNARKDSKDGVRRVAAIAAMANSSAPVSNSDESSHDSSSLKVEAFSETGTSETPPTKKRRGRPRGSLNGGSKYNRDPTFFPGIKREREGSEEVSYTQKIQPKPEKVLIDPEVLKDAVIDLAEKRRESSRNTPETPRKEDEEAKEARKKERLKEVKDELMMLRSMAFHLFKSSTELLRTIDD